MGALRTQLSSAEEQSLVLIRELRHQIATGSISAELMAPATSMRTHQINTRLSFARYLLSSTPDMKMSVIAKALGYDDPNVFERFFREHVGSSPHAWSKAEQRRHPQRFQQWGP